MIIPEQVISIKDISKTYSSSEIKVPALRGISLEVAKGDFLMVTGRNGSGKSTLLHQLGLLDYPDSGAIFLNKKEVTKMPEKKRAFLRLNLLGYIFQEYALVPELTALENVMLPAMVTKGFKKAKAKAEELLKKIGLENRSDHLPFQLSGGEQQKVAIARALVNDPHILFADEPTANLDSIVSKEIMEIFKDLNKKEQLTIIMISHEEDEIAYGDRAIKLHDGKLI